jgi:tetratricopeptide (TPR) repeat protein
MTARSGAWPRRAMRSTCKSIPAARQVPDALFRIGECYMKQNQLKQAAGYYEEVVNRYPTSEGAPSAAYRLGAMTFNDSKVRRRGKHFAFCEAKTRSPQVDWPPPTTKAAPMRWRATRKSRPPPKQRDRVKRTIRTAKPRCSRSAASTSARTRRRRRCRSLMNSSKPARTAPSSPRPAIRAAVLYAELKKPDESIADV